MHRCVFTCTILCERSHLLYLKSYFHLSSPPVAYSGPQFVFAIAASAGELIVYMSLSRFLLAAWIQNATSADAEPRYQSPTNLQLVSELGAKETHSIRKPRSVLIPLQHFQSPSPLVSTDQGFVSATHLSSTTQQQAATSFDAASTLEPRPRAIAASASPRRSFEPSSSMDALADGLPTDGSASLAASASSSAPSASSSAADLLAWQQWRDHVNTDVSSRRFNAFLARFGGIISVLCASVLLLFWPDIFGLILLVCICVGTHLHRSQLELPILSGVLVGCCIAAAVQFADLVVLLAPNSAGGGSSDPSALRVFFGLTWTGVPVVILLFRMLPVLPLALSVRAMNVLRQRARARPLSATWMLLAADIGDIEYFQRAQREASAAEVGSIRNHLGQTLLHVCCKRGHSQLLPLLLSVVPVDVQDMFGNTALHAAIAGGHQSPVSLLLHAGANPRLKNMQGRYYVDIDGEMTKEELLQTLAVLDFSMAENTDALFEQLEVAAWVPAHVSLESFPHVLSLAYAISKPSSVASSESQSAVASATVNLDQPAKSAWKLLLATSMQTVKISFAVVLHILKHQAEHVSLLLVYLAGMLQVDLLHVGLLSFFLAFLVLPSLMRRFWLAFTLYCQLVVLLVYSSALVIPLLDAASVSNSVVEAIGLRSVSAALYQFIGIELLIVLVASVQLSVYTARRVQQNVAFQRSIWIINAVDATTPTETNSVVLSSQPDVILSTLSSSVQAKSEAEMMMHEGDEIELQFEREIDLARKADDRGERDGNSRSSSSSSRGLILVASKHVYNFFHEIGLPVCILCFLIAGLLPPFSAESTTSKNKHPESIIKLGLVLIFLASVWITQLSRAPRRVLSRAWFVVVFYCCVTMFAAYAGQWKLINSFFLRLQMDGLTLDDIGIARQLSNLYLVLAAPIVCFILSVFLLRDFYHESEQNEPQSASLHVAMAKGERPFLVACLTFFDCHFGMINSAVVLVLIIAMNRPVDAAAVIHGPAAMWARVVVEVGASAAVRAGKRSRKAWNKSPRPIMR